MLRMLSVVSLSLVIGALGAVWGIHKSRDPESWPFALRSKVGVAPQDTSEANWLERQYGPAHHSTNLEEWIIRDFFNDKRHGVFVDVGAADAEQVSNTWYLEKQLGWSGVAIDAQESYRPGYAQHRPRTKFFSLFVSDRSDQNARLFISNAGGTSSSERDFAQAYGGVKQMVDVPTITLDDLLAAQGITSFDFLSMDIELAEPAGLAGLDIERFHPSLAVVEAHPQVRQQILDYFTSRRYTPVGKYLRADIENVWFMPLGSSVTPFPPEHKAEEWRK
jgi:FkbM family methyltransferase